MSEKQHKPILVFTILLATLICITSYHGLFIQDFYANETLNWQAQSTGQDFINLFFIVPVLLISSYFTLSGVKKALLIWAGIILYLIYTYMIYCFSVHFNNLFILYCFILGISFYSIIYFFHNQVNFPIIFEMRNKRIINFVAIYFILIAVAFYTLWLIEIVPSILSNSKPGSLNDTGLVTNPVHVLDLSIILPGIFCTGILLLKRNPFSCLLTPLLLTFFILMDLTIAGLVFILKYKGLESDLMITLVMLILALISGFFLRSFSTQIIKHS